MMRLEREIGGVVRIQLEDPRTALELAFTLKALQGEGDVASPELARLLVFLLFWGPFVFH